MSEDTPDIIKIGEEWLEGQRIRHLSRPVTYARGEGSVDVRATVGRTVFEVDDGTGILEQYESRDFIIRAADLVIDDVAVSPERGDRIRETQDGIVYVYEVMAPGRLPHAKFSDRSRRTLRIHTKLVDTEE